VLAAGLAGSAGSNAQAATLHGPKAVYPGGGIMLRTGGFEPNINVSFVAQAQSCIGTNTGSVALGTGRTEPSGALVVRFRWPRRFYICRGYNNCGKHPWHNNHRALITACSVAGGQVFLCARHWVVVRTK
jgi:hypothetical protein